MRNALTLMVLINCDIIQVSGVLEWTVIGKVTDYGQNVTLFCNVPHCCPKDAGWDRWTPVQQTLFIDIKTGRPNKKYDGKVLKDGYTLIIQNLTEKDLNVSYSCLYGVTLGERKFLLEEDVFSYIVTTRPNSQPAGQIAGLIVGVIVLVAVALAIAQFVFYSWRRRKKGKFDYQVVKDVEEDINLTKKDRSDIECNEGENVIFTYDAQNENQSVKWLKAIRKNVENEHWKVSDGKGQFKFELTNTKKSDEGEYRVQVGKLIRKRFLLNIKVYFLDDPLDVDCKEGDEAILKCKVLSGSPSVKWLKDGKAVTGKDIEINSQDVLHTLKLKNAKPSDSGEYYVQVGTSCRKIQLTVGEISKEISRNERNTYMKAIENGTEVREYVRIQVIGKDHVGKTSLVRRLLQQEFQDVKSTDGIEINRNCQIRKSDGKWFYNEGEPEKTKRIKRILQAINEKKKPQETVSDPSSPYNQQLGKTFSKSKESHNGQEPKQSTYSLDTKTKQNKLLPNHEKQTEEPIIVTELIKPPNIISEENQLTEADSVASRKEKTSNKKNTKNCSKENQDKNSSEKADEITKAIIENMNEILVSVKNQKGKNASDDLVECGIWDFAGQKDYYATHQTFFTPYAIYILVADITDDIKVCGEDVNFDSIGDYISFWFDSIHCFCKDPSAKQLCPPVIMVCTGTDKVAKVYYNSKYVMFYRLKYNDDVSESLQWFI